MARIGLHDYDLKDAAGVLLTPPAELKVGDKIRVRVLTAKGADRTATLAD